MFEVTLTCLVCHAHSRASCLLFLNQRDPMSEKAVSFSVANMPTHQCRVSREFRASSCLGPPCPDLIKKAQEFLQSGVRGSTRLPFVPEISAGLECPADWGGVVVSPWPLLALPFVCDRCLHSSFTWINYLRLSLTVQVLALTLQLCGLASRFSSQGWEAQKSYRAYKCFRVLWVERFGEVGGPGTHRQRITGNHLIRGL